MFWILLPLLILVAIALFVPLWRRPRQAVAEQSVDALNVLRDQREELDEEVASGRMTEAEREARIAELTRRVHDEGLAEATATAPDVPATRKVWLAAALALLIPAIAVPLYIVVGTPQALDPAVRMAAAAKSRMATSLRNSSAMLDTLKARLDTKPDDLNGWMMLGRGLQLMNDFAGGAAAFEKAAALRPDDPQLLADYADSLAMAQNRQLQGKPWELIQQALKIDPHQPKALALAASAEYEQGRFDAAKGYWQRMLAVIPPDSEDATEIRNMIAQVEGKPAGAAPAVRPGRDGAGRTGPHGHGGRARRALPTPAGKAITGVVRLAPALAGKMAPDDTLFIFARAAEGSRMPLAILRLKAWILPKQFPARR